ncbi:hypothetical protein GOBAR_AA19564 [Gossypium barbadense]|uniref:Reverse transcriptase zinc-binding domain-containing protein n=1 Tax=Gossypium barbadense TaxID=3634 RepID=A0A2P5XCN9_GOSBA|nr:hypothetical protein GOBAR_AA19564 [Gossypium barbadense]
MWHFSSNGRYIVKTGWLYGTTLSLQWCVFFLWRCTRNFVPCKSRLLNILPNCSRCGSTETLEDAVFECDKARENWEKARGGYEVQRGLSLSGGSRGDRWAAPCQGRIKCNVDAALF